MVVDPIALRRSHPYRLFDRHPLDEHYAGRTLDVVRLEAAAEGRDVRVWADPPAPGIGFNLDHRPDRLNLVVRDGLVVDAAFF